MFIKLTRVVGSDKEEVLIGILQITLVMPSLESDKSKGINSYIEIQGGENLIGVTQSVDQIQQLINSTIADLAVTISYRMRGV